MADEVAEARRLYQEALDASGKQRRQIKEDIAFTDPSDPQQWDEQIEAKRKNDPGGARPCLVFDQLGQYISNVAGQVEQRPPSMHALPVEGGDKRAAEQLDGFFRHIEHASRARNHYARALTSAARVGVGYLIVRPSYVNRALNWQEPRISSEGDPLKVVFDPWSQELDGSDAEFGFLLTKLSHRAFEAEFGKRAKKVSFAGDDTEDATDERESVVVAECWRTETKRTTCYVVMLDGQEESLSEDDYVRLRETTGQAPQVVAKYPDTVKVVKWSRMSGDAVLSTTRNGDKGETEYPASSIGIVPVYGYVSFADGRLSYCGMGRRAMNPQRSYNYHMSELHAYMATAPKAPWLVPVRALKDESLKDLWDKASTEQRAYLPYHDIDESGPIAPPTRAQPSVNLQNHMAGAERALQDIQAALGMYQANLGAPSNETSGVAIDARKEQGEASTANFPANLAASVAQVGRICVEMIPRLMDKRRQVRILGLDGSIGSVTIDPQQAEPSRETDKGLSINPNAGRYDVRVVVGPAYTTQRTQTQEALNEVMARNPALMPAIAPLWAQTLDIPNADKLSQVLTAVAPPEVKAVLQPNNEESGPTTAELVAQNQKLQEALQAAIAEAESAQRELDEATDEKARLESESEARAQEVEIKQYQAETDRLKVIGVGMTPEQVQAIAAQTALEAVTQQQPEREEAPQPAEPQPNQEVQALAQQMEQLSQAVSALAELVRRPREKIPVRGPDGSIQRVIEMIPHSAQDAPLQ